MDEITMFAELRPSDAMTDAELADIRAELFPHLEPQPDARPAAARQEEVDLTVRTLPIGDAESQRPQRRSRTVASAAAAVAVLGLGGLWAAANRDDGAAPAPAAQPAGATTAPDVSRPPDNSAASTSSSLPLCTDAGCDGFDPLPVNDGATDFYLGPESLGEPVVHTDWFDTLTRCVTLSADLGSCDKIEGIAGVNLVSYPLDTGEPAATDDAQSGPEISIGTTFTDLDPATYATRWGPTQGDGPQTNTTVRGHPAINYLNETDPAVIWQERPGVLVWVAVPPAREDDLMDIAEAIRVTDGPATIPNRVIITDLAEPWDAWDNDGDGLIVATSDGQECVGLNYIDTCGSDISQRTIVRIHSDGTATIAGSTTANATSIRITTTGNDPIEINTIPFANYPSRYYSTTVPAGVVETIIWLDSTGTELDRYTPQLTAPDSSDGVQLYTTIDGDTLATIAEQFGFSPDDTAPIAAHNGWTGIGPDDPLDAGTVVMIPPTTIRPTTTMVPEPTCADGDQTAIPSVAGMAYPAAVDKLLASGLSFEVMREAPPEGETATDNDYAVVDQGTTPGDTVACGAEVRITAAWRPGKLHPIEPGETWESIAATQDIPVVELLGFNGFTVAELEAAGESTTSPLEVGRAISLSIRQPTLNTVPAPTG
ncbi:PASTA domain-containing protein [Ilumatobacter coccineus]|uniref:LysM domain-containing protein n=1 Tax=Ilumatobacter coccineus (strain NBRC 103263 / KCTC 29153 / YM16-304) TaxID=1313172 RepID=A0A6C7E8N1_ILUCY|nr:LysM peptidoglycan-binding domain-containing protein [Ilumatobacter coccineus]BAN01559.1 hypothetical protein YM304_12450 [Ilumatobacter coccineus YM16-304]